MNPPRSGRGRGRPEKPVNADFGPARAIQAGRVVLTYRTDPEAPHAPVIRGARRKVIYHELWLIGYLTDEQHEAADRYLMRLEQAGGAKADARGHSGGRSFGPSEVQVMALADLRGADFAIGADALRDDVRQVIGWNIWPKRLAPEAFRDALGRMAHAWRM